MSFITGLIQQHVPLADKNWFKTGGSAEYYAAPETPQEFSEAIIYARKHNLPITILGEGANVLISDAGISGLVIHPALKNISFIQNSDHIHVTAGAGVSMHELIDACLAHSALGLEEFSGIPGTVGGSVFINIHYFEFLLSKFITQATVINAQTGEIIQVDHAWFNFSYNYSTLHENNYYLVDATFKLRLADSPLDVAYAQGRKKEIIRHRQSRYPNSGTCGSFFRNFYPEEVTLESMGKKLIFVAYYLDKIGVKGALSCGGAVVSYQHANMLVNSGTATTADLITVARTMQQKVFDAYGITPQPECRLLGFTEYPLIK
jgi:UDP-N-acetylmuramate dehydrogenase